jgi:hypothetical protein
MKICQAQKRIETSQLKNQGQTLNLKKGLALVLASICFLFFFFSFTTATFAATYYWVGNSDYYYSNIDLIML